MNFTALVVECTGNVLRFLWVTGFDTQGAAQIISRCTPTVVVTSNTANFQQPDDVTLQLLPISHHAPPTSSNCILIAILSTSYSSPDCDVSVHSSKRREGVRMMLESLARVFKVQLPAYLKRLPIPDSIAGFIRLTVLEWLRLLPFLGVLALLGYLAIRPFLPKKKQQKDSLINLKIQKENPKVVNEINIEDLHLAKAAYCRCWRSKTFPVCDGSHNKHNELTGDNVGPLILKKKEV
ncbi:hypothetical protein XELAEV_18009411mg [Xenopus laevis]|nr:hypothetical protein XELAEV_18009411mg [Xenopus laevis]